MNRKSLFALLPLVAILLLPLFLRDAAVRNPRAADPLVIVTPHNEAIRYEFERAFSAWYRQKTGREVDIDWRTPGGTSEIVRHLTGEYTAGFRHEWTSTGHPWNATVQAAVLDRKLKRDKTPPEAWDARQAFLASSVSSGMDLFFGGGQYDQSRLADQGILVPCGLRERHPELFSGEQPLIPQQASGEIWYDPGDRYYSTCLTAFGICYNPERLRDARPPAGIAAPRQWRDLGDPAYFNLIGLGDPSKSGSVAKCYEMLLQQELAGAVAAVPRELTGAARKPAEAAALARGWDDGLLLIRRIAGNSRYFTNSAGKVPMDVAAGDAAAGMCIDFYGRFQQEYSRDATPDADTLRYLTPEGGSSVSGDPIGLLRGAPHGDAARLFIDFVFSREGQQLWDYKLGAPGGPQKYALHRLPIRRDLYSDTDRANMTDPEENPFTLAAEFTYHGEWTGPLFNLLRVLIRVMVVDCHDELKAAWAAIREAGGPDQVPAAMAELRRLPFTYAEAGEVSKKLGSNKDTVQLAREWAVFFREHYTKARQLASSGPT